MEILNLLSRGEEGLCPKALMAKHNFRNCFIVVPIAWMAVIFLFSHQAGTESAALSGSITAVVIKFASLFGLYIEEVSAHSLIRSLAHFLMFFVLGALWYINFCLKGMTSRKAAMLSAVIGIAYAITDELHQLLVPGRACELKDVAVDSAGVLLAVGLGHYIKCKKFVEV